MVDLVMSIASKVAEYLVAPISKGATYLLCFKQFIGDVDKAKEELELKLADVEKLKEEADRKTEEIMPSVKKWLDDLNAILEDVQKLQQEIEGGGNKCFNVSQRYSLAKQMEDKAKQMMDLKQNAIFEPFSQLKQLPSILNISSKGFMDFNSRKSTYNHVLKAIKDDSKKMVGLYGIGGSGKTTLVEQVGSEMDKLKFFDKVVMAVISKPPNVWNIQQQIAEQIGLPLQEALARALRLSERLKNMKILVILDDVWEHLRLEDVGIPLVEGHHILLTTRLRNVCTSMGCKRIIELPLIAKEEAWELFKKHANLFDEGSGEFHDVGRKIIDECKELPIAIVTVGSSLKGKHNIEAWRYALWRLKHSRPTNVESGLRSPYACLELSYDNLPSSTTKSLFLLCSMFPEDHAIHKEDLIRFGKGTIESEEIIITMVDARREILEALRILLDSCLLMSTDDQACVKMHDLVRDVALWIARKQGKAILVDSKEISNILASNHQSLKVTKALSLWNLDENFKLSNQLHCPTIEIMLLHPHGLIEDLGAIDGLKVLALIKFSFTWDWRSFDWRSRSPFDWSIFESLTNLHNLCLRGINLGDFSFLGELKGLEILDLRGSTFNELSAAIVDMKMLKILDIFGCEIGKSPLEVIGRCVQLEELYFWDNKSAISENFSLSKLKRYAIYDSTCGFGSYKVPFQKYFDSYDEALRFICIRSFKVSTLNSSMKDLIHRANFLWLANCGWDHKDINIGIKHLGVSRCQGKRFIIDHFEVNFLQTQVFSHLVTLIIAECSQLERLIEDDEAAQGNPLHDQQNYPCGNEADRAYMGLTAKSPTTQFVSLHRLEEVVLQRCSKLKNIFTSAIVTNLPELRKVAVHDCEEWKGIFCEKSLESLSSSLVCFPRLEKVKVYHCHKLKRLFPHSLASHCPSLKEITIYDCSQLEGVAQAYEGEVVDDHHERLLFPKLRLLHLEGLPKLREIFSRYGNETDGAYLGLTTKNPTTQLLSLHRLQEVILQRCPKLKNIVTPAIVTNLPELRKVAVHDCEELEGIFCEKSVKSISSSIVCFPKLEKVAVYNCCKVKRLFSHSLPSHFPSLEEITIYGCSQLERVVQAFEGEVVDDHHGRLLFPKLKLLDLHGLPKLREIYSGYGNETDGAYVGLTAKSPTTQFVSLHRLEEVMLMLCPKLKNIFPPAIVTNLPELWKVVVYNCEEWEGICCEKLLKSISSSIVCFPKLERVKVYNCRKVKRLFSHSLASHCPSLEKIDICDCSQLEGVVQAYEGEVVDDHHEMLLFPRLQLLTLQGLPRLREIYSWK